MQKACVRHYFLLTLSFTTFSNAVATKKRARGSQAKGKVGNIDRQRKLTEFYKKAKKNTPNAPEIEEAQQELVEDDVFNVESDLPEDLSALQNQMINALNSELHGDFLVIFNACVTLSEDGSATLSLDEVKDDETLLLWAARHDASELASLLIDNGASVDTSVGDKTPLFVAASLGLIDFCRLLINNGASVEQEYRYKNALHKAAKDQSREVCLLLAGTMNTIDAPTYNGYSALSYASRKGDAELCRYFLQRGASASRVTSTGISVLMLAIMGKSFETVQLFIRSGANVTTVSNEGNTALHYAVRTGSAALVNLLLENGVDVHRQNNNGETALHVAAINQNSEIAYLILLHTYSLRLNGMYAFLLSLKKNATDEQNKYISEGTKLLYRQRKKLLQPPLTWLLDREAQGLRNLLEAQDKKGKRAYDYLNNRGLNPKQVDRFVQQLLKISVAPLAAVEALIDTQKIQKEFVVKDGNLVLA